MVFAMPGCPACEEYQPRLEAHVQSFIAVGHPFMFYSLGATILPGQIPVLILDSTSDDAEIQSLMDQHEIQALPTTVVLCRRGDNKKVTGALTDRDTYDMLVEAVKAN